MIFPFDFEGPCHSVKYTTARMRGMPNPSPTPKPMARSEDVVVVVVAVVVVVVDAVEEEVEVLESQGEDTVTRVPVAPQVEVKVEASKDWVPTPYTPV